MTLPDPTTPPSPKPGWRSLVRLLVLSVIFWWLLGVPFILMWWSGNDAQGRMIQIALLGVLPLVGWTGAGLLPWWLARRGHTRSIGVAVFASTLFGFALVALQLHQGAELPGIEVAKLLVQGCILGGFFRVVAAPPSERRWPATLLTLTLVSCTGLQLILAGLARQQEGLERERGAALLAALADGVRNGTPLPDLTGLGPRATAWVVDRASGRIRLGPGSGNIVDSLQLDGTGQILTGGAEWGMSRRGEHLVVAHLPLALPDDPGVVLLAVSPIGDYGTPLLGSLRAALLVLGACLIISLLGARQLDRRLGAPG